ncbi:MAG: hypothetical protein K0U45_10430 [Alphaproteobacteria bacterium]|nr:hypothetical protein [Alphaproteobacteria bacterium]
MNVINIVRNDKQEYAKTLQNWLAGKDKNKMLADRFAVEISITYHTRYNLLNAINQLLKPILTKINIYHGDKNWRKASKRYLLPITFAFADIAGTRSLKLHPLRINHRMQHSQSINTISNPHHHCIMLVHDAYRVKYSPNGLAAIRKRIESITGVKTCHITLLATHKDKQKWIDYAGKFHYANMHNPCLLDDTFIVLKGNASYDL